MCIGYTCIHYVSYMFINAEYSETMNIEKYIYIYIWVEMFIIVINKTLCEQSIKVSYWSGNLGSFKFTLQRYIASDVDVMIIHYLNLSDVDVMIINHLNPSDVDVMIMHCLNF